MPEIPESFNEIASDYNLTVKYDPVMARWFVRDESRNAALLCYRPWELAELTAEQFRVDIDEAIENYQPHEPANIVDIYRDQQARRHILTGQWRATK